MTDRHAAPPTAAAPAVRMVAAVDIGATKTLVTVRPAATAGAGDRTARSSAWSVGADVARLATDRDAASLADRIALEVRALLAGSGGRLVAVGVGAPGPLDPATGLVVHSPNLGWRDVPLGRLLSERLDAPVALEDDANAAALGEWQFGAGAGADPFAFITVSSGVGSGIVVGGALLRGAHGLAGEVGHLTVDAEGPRCGCGRRGCVEAYVGGAALARRARQSWRSELLADGSPAPRDADGVLRAARHGDPVALGLAGEAAEALGRALAAVAASIDPQRIAVGGALALGQPALVRRAVSIARRRCIRETAQALTVVPAALGAESVLAGAAAAALRLASERAPS